MEKAFGFVNGQFWNNPNLIQKLNLGDDQRKAMDGILQDHRMKLIDLRANLEKAEVEMIPLMKADTPDAKAIEAQIDKVVAARAELEKANARFLLDIRLQLKPEQWKQLEALRMQKMQRERMGEQGRGQWGHDGQRPGMGGQFRGPGGQFHMPPQDGQPPANVPPPDAPVTAPPPPAPGSGAGDTQ
jgi:Spy/CpxP family protein refolding chaperone